MKSKLSLSLFIILSLALSSITTQAKKLNTQDRQIPSFSKISVSSGIDLYLTQSTSEQIRVEADSEIIDKIVTEVKGETLHIYLKNSDNWNWGWSQERKVFVSFDDLIELDASAGSDVEAEDQVKTDRIRISCSSGSDVTFKNLLANDVYADCSSGADIELAGSTHKLTASSSSGSDIDCEDLVAEVCDARASSGSDIVLCVTKELTANASSGGDINYKGSPAKKNINESSGGDVDAY